MDLLSHLNVDDEYDKLVLRMNPPRVAVDNEACDETTLVKVHSANKHGILLEVVQVLAEFDLVITKAHISSDNYWFMDVFYVKDQKGKKITDERLIEQIKQSLGRNASLLPEAHMLGKQPAASSDTHTVIELTGTDRPGLLSEVLAILRDCGCNIIDAETWTHNMKAACVFHVYDGTTGAAIEKPQSLSKIKQRLDSVMYPGPHSCAIHCTNATSSNASMASSHTCTERRLHQMMSATGDFERLKPSVDADVDVRPQVKIHNIEDRGYSMLTIECRDRSKLLFDVVCTLTDLDYVIFHASVESQGTNSYQEHYIRHIDGHMIDSETERQRIAQCLEAAIERRVSEGLRIEMKKRSISENVLPDAVRLFRENGLSVARAEIMNNGENEANVFYVRNATGKLVDSNTLERIERTIAKTDLQFKASPSSSSSNGGSSRKGGRGFSLSEVIKSGPARLLSGAANLI